MSKRINITKEFEEKTKKNGQFYLTRITNELFLFMELPITISAILISKIDCLELVRDYDLHEREGYGWYLVATYTFKEDTLAEETAGLDFLKKEKEKIVQAIEQFCGPEYKIMLEIMCRSAWHHHEQSMNNQMKKVRIIL